MLDPHTADVFRRFTDHTLPKEQWTHDAHLTVCWAVLASRDEPDALAFLRDAIRSYNTATGVENTRTSGYHETLTVYFVRAVAALGARTVDEVLAAPTCERAAPLRYWTRNRLFSREARAHWVAPDLVAGFGDVGHSHDTDRWPRPQRVAPA